ncbi:Gfo/Idh/MocA family oxidoreductase [Curtobacterium flaccumfaciens]|nr:Gfo/Idh/MocA family oxidoreductase [Curtobacterium flaccumfaciens]
MSDSIGVAVIGAGMAGKAHMAAWRNAPSLFTSTLPPVRLVSVGDVYEPLAAEAARRFGYERHDTDWRAIAAADDIDVVSVVVANTLHREIVEGLLAAGKHVLCEKPLSDSLDDARAMASAAAEAEQRRSSGGSGSPTVALPGSRPSRSSSRTARSAGSCTSRVGTGPTTAPRPTSRSRGASRGARVRGARRRRLAPVLRRRVPRRTGPERQRWDVHHVDHRATRGRRTRPAGAGGPAHRCDRGRRERRLRHVQCTLR